jgi:TonB family protein
VKTSRLAPPGTIIALAVLVLLSPAPPAAAAIDANRFYTEMSAAETIDARIELCAQLSYAETPPYIVSLCQCLQAFAGGSDSLAAILIEESLRLKPDFVLGVLALGDSYAEQSRWKFALRWYGRAKRIAPDRLDPYYGIGRVWLDRGATEGTAAYEEALKAFREMTRLDPEGADGWSNVGMVLATLGRYDEAEESYRKALVLSPDNPDLYNGLGSLASRRGNDADAETYWTKCLSINPAHATTAVELAALYGRQGKLTEAFTVLEGGVNAARVGPAAGRLRRDLALLSLLEERPARAVSLLEEARVMSPDARTLAALAHVRMLRSETDQAVPLMALAATKDSAVVRPFARAWQTQLATALPGYAKRDAGGAAILQKLIAKPLGPNEPAGAFASGALVRRLLPDWKLPDGPLGPRDEAPSEEYDTPPTPIYRAMATYPDTAVGIEGTVQVRVRIDVQGAVKDAKVIGDPGNPALEWAALDAAKQWRFSPATRNGHPVESEVTIPFRFSGSQ